MPPEDNSQLPVDVSQTPEAPLTPVQMTSETPPPSLKQIRTFQGDIAGALERQNESLFSIQQVEQLKRASGGSVPEEPGDDGSRRKELFLLTLGGIVLIFLGVAGAWYGYQEYLRKTAPPVIVAPESRLISIQKSINIDTTGISRDALLGKISEESLGLKSGEIKHLVLRKGLGETSPLLTTTELLGIIKVQAPGGLVRSFEPIFMLGALGGEGGGRFVIVRLSSFENAFAGMLSWEKTLGPDLGPVFSTNSEIQSTTDNTFKDVISNNKDVRVLSTGTGTSTKPVLLYSFFDNKMLIITENLDTLKTLIDRLTQALLIH